MSLSGFLEAYHPNSGISSFRDIFSEYFPERTLNGLVFAVENGTIVQLNAKTNSDEPCALCLASKRNINYGGEFI